MVERWFGGNGLFVLEGLKDGTKIGLNICRAPFVGQKFDVLSVYVAVIFVVFFPFKISTRLEWFDPPPRFQPKNPCG